MSARKRIPLYERIDARIDRSGGCWLWPGAKSSNGYGYVKADAPSREKLLVHRVMYERYHGAVPDGLHIDHLCYQPACCNPAHLEAVAPAENQRRIFTCTHCGLRNPLRSA